MTSLGCHTDLWNPSGRRFSSLVDTLGIGGKSAPARKSSDVLGCILPWVAISHLEDPRSEQMRDYAQAWIALAGTL